MPSPIATERVLYNQVLLEHGFDPANIITMMYDDLAQNMQNPTKGVIINQWPALEPLFDEWADQMTDLHYGQSAHAFSDHYPYLVEGLCTSYIGNPRGKFTGRGWGHTRFDTLDKIDIRNLRAASSLAARVTLRAANAEEWPVSRRPRADVETMMDAEADLREMRVVKKAYRELYDASGKAPVTAS